MLLAERITGTLMSACANGSPPMRRSISQYCRQVSRIKMLRMSNTRGSMARYLPGNALPRCASRHTSQATSGAASTAASTPSLRVSERVEKYSTPPSTA